MTTHERALRAAADLEELWAWLFGGPEGPDYGLRTLWLMVLDAADRPLKILVPLEGVPDELEYSDIEALGRVLNELMAETSATSVAIALSRPGDATMTDADRRFALTVRREFGSLLGGWPIHLATRHRLQVFAPDDLIAVPR